ncbi:MAG: hypothetical protein DWQ09_04955 [Proteobacteria bacterium]|nr:MAG: hypothetical protein DWQ09_04955 [Pseudomonadota bacterium]QKK11310.1 MAG: hypothetical protein HND59_06620 [Pseudomonadota bacterium]
MFKTQILVGLHIGLMTLLLGCATVAPTKSGLELQAIQSKSFDADKATAFASVLTVFQDLGYIVESADKDTGFITAKSPTKSGFMLFVGPTRTFTKATAFIESHGDMNSRIRLNFVESRTASGAYGQQHGEDSAIDDAKIYENAFAKIREAIFIRNATK